MKTAIIIFTYLLIVAFFVLSFYGMISLRYSSINFEQWSNHGQLAFALLSFISFPVSVFINWGFHDIARTRREIKELQDGAYDGDKGPTMGHGY